VSAKNGFGRSGPEVRMSVVVFALCAIALTPLSCDRTDDEDQTAYEIYSRMPEMAMVPQTLEVKNVEVGKRITLLGELVVGIPDGWRVTETGDDDRTGKIECEAKWEGRYVKVRFSFGTHPSPTRQRPLGLLGSLGSCVADPRGFLDKFRSDLEFVEAVYNAVPADLIGVSREKGAEVRALLGRKNRRVLPVRKVDRPWIHAFIWKPVPGVLVAEVFDGSGTSRGAVNLRFPESLDPAVADKLLGRVLVGSRFRK